MIKAQACFMGISDSEDSQSKVPKFSFNSSEVQLDYLVTNQILGDSVSSKVYKTLQYVVEELTYSNVFLNKKIKMLKLILNHLKTN